MFGNRNLHASLGLWVFTTVVILSHSDPNNTKLVDKFGQVVNINDIPEDVKAIDRCMDADPGMSIQSSTSFLHKYIAVGLGAHEALILDDRSLTIVCSIGECLGDCLTFPVFTRTKTPHAYHFSHGRRNPILPRIVDARKLELKKQPGRLTYATKLGLRSNAWAPRPASLELELPI